MKNLRRFLSLLLAMSTLLAMSMTAYAAVEDTGYSDVEPGIWYTEAVEYMRDNGLMNGTGGTAFSPYRNTSRAMLATVLYRAAGSPVVSGEDSFMDTMPGVWYSNAVVWASQQGLVNGYGNGLFGTDDPVTREQIVTILWRYAGSPAVESGQDFADESEISAYAAQAVDWARTNSIVSGVGDNRFDPQGYATRAQIAVILYNYLTLETELESPDEDESETPNEPETPEEDEAETPDEPETPVDSSGILVVYFSATGSTENVAKVLADELGADTFELVPVTPYTSADLNWTNPDSRVNEEHNDTTLRNIELVADTVENWDAYNTVLIGYPIWWGIAAWPVNRFVTGNDFTGKTVIPFCTSASSGLGESGELLAEMAGTGDWLEGQRFSSTASETSVRTWAESLNLTTPSTPEQEGRTLVVYFSMPETTDPNNMTTEEANSTVVIDGEVLGNTQYMAYVIQEQLGADVFRIEPEIPYPTDHTTLVAQAREEQNQDARPAIQNTISGFEDYDTVFIGYPIWWSDMPQILYTFFDSYDFSGKTIIPFSTHGGSSFAGTPSTIQRLEPNAAMLDGLTISRDNIQDARQEIINWVNGLDI